MKVAVLGAGAWGTAISCVLASRLEVALWARDPQQAQTIGTTRRNDRYLPGFELPSTVSVSADLSAATQGASLVLAATPVAGLRELLSHLRAQPTVWLCKGFEQGTGELPHQIAQATLGESARFGALSGPSFAESGGRPAVRADTRVARRRIRARGGRDAARRPHARVLQRRSRSASRSAAR